MEDIASVEEVRKRLRVSDGLTDTVVLPSDLAVLLTSGRPEELAGWSARSLAEDEASGVVACLRVALEANAALRDHCHHLESRLRDLASALWKAGGEADRLEALAGFRTPLDIDGGD